MATIYPFQFKCVPLSDALDESSGQFRISPSELKKYYPSYYHRVIEECDYNSYYLVCYCNCSLYPGRLRTYYAVLPFRSISSYVTPYDEISPCLSESQLKRFALIIRCCNYRFFRFLDKTNVYRDFPGINLERAL